MSDANPYHPPDPLPARATGARPYDPQYDGLRGWLILIGIGVLFSPLMLARHLLDIIRNVFLSDAWSATTTAGSPAYHRLWAPFISAEVVVTVLSLIVVIVMVPMFFSKKKIFPKVYIWLHVFTLIFVVADAFALQMIRPDLPIFDPATAKEVGRCVFTVCVWVPYMMVSTRVASTFRR